MRYIESAEMVGVERMLPKLGAPKVNAEPCLRLPRGAITARWLRRSKTQDPNPHSPRVYTYSLTLLPSYRLDLLRPNSLPNRQPPPGPLASPHPALQQHPLMDFLKSAVASAIAKGSSFPFSLGDRVDIGDSIWTLHNGTKRVGWSPAPVAVVSCC